MQVFQSFKRLFGASKVPGAGDFNEVRETLKNMMEDPDWDDGSYAPVLIRLAWHSSGTYDKETNTGGSNGATMRFPIESNDPENAGLEHARKILEPVKTKHPWISYSDLWILAAYVALEVTGGPVVEFTPGRGDKVAKDAIKPGKLPEAEHGLGEKVDAEGRLEGWENLAQHIRDVFYRMGFNDREIVALISGGHMYGRCHIDRSGYQGAWVEAPTKFSNEFAADLLQDEWMLVTSDTKVNGQLVPEETRPAAGKRQYMTKWEPPIESELQPSDVTLYPTGRYVVVAGWINIRRTHLPDSYIIDQPKRDTEFNIVAIKQFGKGVRGQLECGGWASILATDGEEVLMKRVGDLDLSLNENAVFRLLGTFVSNDEAIICVQLVPESLNRPVADARFLPAGVKTINISEIQPVFNNGVVVEIFGKISEPNLGDLNGCFVKLVDRSKGSFFERVVKDYNETPRKAVKKMQVKYQMMLPSDMVLLWDPEFCKHLKDFAADEESLKADFGAAYKRLTELGVPGCPALH